MTEVQLADVNACQAWGWACIAGICSECRAHTVASKQTGILCKPHLAALLGARAAGENCGARLQVGGHALEQGLQLGVRLGGQDLRRQHHGRLGPRAGRRHDGQEGHCSLPAAHIALRICPQTFRLNEQWP